MSSFPSPNVAKVASVLLRKTTQRRQVYETQEPGQYGVTYSAGTEAQGALLTQHEVDWMLNNGWLAPDPGCPGLFNLRKESPRK